MNKCILISFLFVNFSYLVQAQTDSLLVRIKRYRAIGDSLYFSSNDQASEMNYKKADSLYEGLFAQLQKKQDSENLMDVGIQYAEYLRRIRRNFEKAIVVSQKVLDIAMIEEDSLIISDSYYVMGASYLSMDENIKALENLNKGLSVLDKKKYPIRTWKFYYYRSQLLDGLDKKKALEDIRKAKGYISGDFPDIYKLHTYKTFITLLPTDQLDSIQYYAILADPLLDQNAQFIYWRHYNELMYIYHKNNLVQKARKILTDKLAYCKFEETFEICPDPVLIHTVGLIDKALGNTEQAIRKFEYAQQEFENLKSYASLIETTLDLSSSYEKVGNYKKSTELLRPINAYRDSLAEITLKKEIEKIEARKLVAEQEEVIQVLEEENAANSVTISRISLYTYVLGMSLLILVAFVVYRNSREKLKLHKLNEQISINRLHNLTSAMNPHFLFNCFSTLQNLILNNYTLKANDYMTELSGLIRNILSSSDSIYILLSKEIEILKAYCKLESERLQNRFLANFHVDLELEPDRIQIPSMLFQPLIENAIKHGFAEKDKEDSKLWVRFEKVGEDKIRCSVKDNGIGREKAGGKKDKKTSDHLSIATGNIDERLHIISILQNDTTEVSIIDHKSETGEAIGTEVVVILPLIESIKSELKYA